MDSLYSPAWFEDALRTSAEKIDRDQWQRMLRTDAQEDPLSALRLAAVQNGGMDIQMWAAEIAKNLGAERDDLRRRIGQTLETDMTEADAPGKYDYAKREPSFYAEGWASHKLGVPEYACPYKARLIAADAWELGHGQREFACEDSDE